MTQTEQMETGPVPRHVAIIMDGNVRWAEGRHLSRLKGHRAGTENIRRVIEAFGKSGVKYLTIYAFSTENWQRPRSEVKELMQILASVIGRETKEMHKRVEDSKIAVRNVRRDALEELRKLEKDKKVSRDENVRATDKLQKLTDRFIAEVSKVGADKEAEIMEV